MPSAVDILRWLKSAALNSSTITVDGTNDLVFVYDNDGNIVGTAAVVDLVTSGTAAEGSTPEEITLLAAATTFEVTAIKDKTVLLTGDAGGNTIATITGLNPGDHLVIIFQDSNVTITDNPAGTADTINLSAAFTSAANTTLMLVYDGTSLFEVSRSVNGVATDVTVFVRDTVDLDVRTGVPLFAR